MRNIQCFTPQNGNQKQTSVSYKNYGKISTVSFSLVPTCIRDSVNYGITVILRALHRSTCVSWHTQLRTGHVVKAVLLSICPC